MSLYEPSLTHNILKPNDEAATSSLNVDTWASTHERSLDADLTSVMKTADENFDWKRINFVLEAWCVLQAILASWYVYDRVIRLWGAHDHSFWVNATEKPSSARQIVSRPP